MVPVRSDAFREKVAHLVREAHGISVTAAMIEDAMLPLLGADLDVGDVPIRVGGDERVVVIDLADGSGNAIVVTADGPRLGPSPIGFHRPSGLLPMPTPILPMSADEAQDALAVFWALLDYGDDDEGKHARVATFAWMMSALRRSTNYVLAFVVGEKGSGKTGRVRMMRDVVDPYDLDVESLPQDLEQLAVCAGSSHAQAWDNVSRVSLDVSDGLCSLATGGGRRVRKFYTEGGAVLFKFARPVIITSIVEAITEGDLLDRALIIRARKPTRRVRDAVLKQRFDALHARVLGALAHLVGVALANLDATTVADDVRMQAAAAFAKAAEVAAGFTPGSVEAAYRRAQGDAVNIASEQALAAAIIKWVAEPTFGCPDGHWEGTPTALHDLLTERVCGVDDKGRLLKRVPKGWPADPPRLGSALRRLVPTLRACGIAVSFDEIARPRTVRVARGGVAEVSAPGARTAAADARTPQESGNPSVPSVPSVDLGSGVGTQEIGTAGVTHGLFSSSDLGRERSTVGTDGPRDPLTIHSGFGPSVIPSVTPPLTQDAPQWHPARVADNWRDTVEHGVAYGLPRLTIEYRLADGRTAHGFYVGDRGIPAAEEAVRGGEVFVVVRAHRYADGEEGLVAVDVVRASQGAACA